MCSIICSSNGHIVSKCAELIGDNEFHILILSRDFLDTVSNGRSEFEGVGCVC